MNVTPNPPYKFIMTHTLDTEFQFRFGIFTNGSTLDSNTDPFHLASINKINN